MLTHTVGSTYSVQDLLACGLAALGIAATGLNRDLKAARLPLLVHFVETIFYSR